MTAETQTELTILMETIEREREARKIAERLLEEKSRELFLAKEQVENQDEALKRTQSQLIHSEKMASVGQLAAGVAHEINNPVGFVTSNIQTLTEYIEVFQELIRSYGALVEGYESGDRECQQQLKKNVARIHEEEDIDYLVRDSGELLKESYDGLVRVCDIVQNLKSFVHRDVAEAELADVNEGIEATLKIAWNELKYRAQLEKKLSDLPRIYCIPGELNQVFLNLIVNAAHAIEDNGVITIETSADQENIYVRVSDTGHGIAEEHLNQLFDPFFTTKPVGEGTGLGLSVSYGIVSRHNGDISVESEVGRGTTFTVRLPRSEDAPVVS